MSRSLLALLVLLLVATVAIPAASASARPSLQVKVTVERKGAAKKTVGRAGASLQVKTRGGGRFVLRIPKGAVAEPTAVTMTPVRAISRYPFRRKPVGAVRITPDELGLAAPAKLTFTPRRRVTRTLIAPFAATGSGADFRLSPVQSAGRSIVMRVTHGGVIGQGEATRAERHALADRTPSDLGNAAEAAMGLIVADALAKGKSLSDPAVRAAIGRVLEPQYRAVLKRLRAHVGGRAGWRAAVQAALRFDKALMFVRDPGGALWEPPALKDAKLRKRLTSLQASIRGVFIQVFTDAYAKAQQACTAGDLGQGNELATIGRELQLLGFEDEAGLDLARVTNDVNACSRLTLEFTSAVTDTFGWPSDACQTVHTAAVQVTGVVPGLGAEPADGVLTVPAATFQFREAGPCSTQHEFVLQQPPQLTELNARLELDVNAVRDAGGNLVDRAQRPPKLSAVWLKPGRGWVMFKLRYPGGGESLNKMTLFWQDLWRIAHRGEEVGGSYPIRDWTLGSGDVLFTKTLDRTGGYAPADAVVHGAYFESVKDSLSGTLGHTTTLTIRHTPAR